jgi:hypothetical protein
LANFAQPAINVKNPRRQQKRSVFRGLTARKLNEKTEKRTLFSAKVAAPEFIGNWSWKANKIKGAKSRLYASLSLPFTQARLILHFWRDGQKQPRGKNVSQGKESQGRYRRSRCSVEPTQARVAGEAEPLKAKMGQMIFG